MIPDLYVKFEWLDYEKETLPKILQSLSHATGFIIPISMVLRLGTGPLKEILEPVAQKQEIMCGTLSSGSDLFPTANAVGWEVKIRNCLIDPRNINLKRLGHLNGETNKRFIIDTQIEDLDGPLFAGDIRAELWKWAGFASLYGFNGAVLPWAVIKSQSQAWTGVSNRFANCKKFISVIFNGMDFDDVKDAWNAACEPGSCIDGLIIRWQDNPYGDIKVQIREIERLIIDSQS